MSRNCCPQDGHFRVDWSEDKYNAAVTEVTALLKMAGFGSQLDNIPMILSSLNDDNVYEKSDKCPWYNGPTVQAIDAGTKQANRQALNYRFKTSTRFQVSDSPGRQDRNRHDVFNPSEERCEVD